MSACSDNQSTILPFPSSPHRAPTTTTLAIRGYSLCNCVHYEHELSGKLHSQLGSGPERHALPDHAPSPNHGRGPLACEAPHRITEAGYRRKQERPLADLKTVFKLLISHRFTRAWSRCIPRH